jgi:transcriptional regulator with XRE-family HTH domain
VYDHRNETTVRVRCHLREIRGRRGIRQIAELCGVPRATLSTIETGRSLPKDAWVEPMEQAYGAPFADWYPALTVRVLELDEEVAA